MRVKRPAVQPRLFAEFLDRNAPQRLLCQKRHQRIPQQFFRRSYAMLRILQCVYPFPIRPHLSRKMPVIKQISTQLSIESPFFILYNNTNKTINQHGVEIFRRFGLPTVLLDDSQTVRQGGRSIRPFGRDYPLILQMRAVPRKPPRVMNGEVFFTEAASAGASTRRRFRRAETA